MFVFLSLFFLLCPQRYYINVIKSNFISKNSYFFMIGIWNLVFVFTNYLHVNFLDMANFHCLILRYFAFLSQRYYINIEKANFISKILLFFLNEQRKRNEIRRNGLFFYRCFQSKIRCDFSTGSINFCRTIYFNFDWHGLTYGKNWLAHFWCPSHLEIIECDFPFCYVSICMDNSIKPDYFRQSSLVSHFLWNTK